MHAHLEKQHRHQVWEWVISNGSGYVARLIYSIPALNRARSQAKHNNTFGFLKSSTDRHISLIHADVGVTDKKAAPSILENALEYLKEMSPESLAEYNEPITENDGMLYVYRLYSQSAALLEVEAKSQGRLAMAWFALAFVVSCLPLVGACLHLIM